jgi:hypothetical protein
MVSSDANIVLASHMKFFYTLFLIAAFCSILAVVYLIHCWYFSVDVVFYSALLDVLIAAALTAILASAFRKRLLFTGLEQGLLVTVWLLAGYAFAISGPAVLDRSLSFYILEKLQQRGGGIRQDAMADMFVDEFMPEMRLVDVRLTEQEQSATIEIVNGCVRLTNKGQEIASFGRFFRNHLLPKHRLLTGVYSDALVDPFAHSLKGPRGYECH